jgi:hypothetical protein
MLQPLLLRPRYDLIVTAARLLIILRKNYRYSDRKIRSHESFTSVLKVQVVFRVDIRLSL